MTECVYLIHSGDKGHWIWPYWYYWYKRHWNLDGKIDTVFLGESWAPEWEGVIPMTTGRGTWGAGLIKALEKIEAKYIFYGHEDYMSIEQPRADVALELVKYMKENGTKLIKASGWDAGFNDASRPMKELDVEVNGKKLWRYNNNSGYLISHQTALWDKEFLISTLVPWMTPWMHEMEGSDALRKRNVEILAYRGEAVIPYAEAVRQNEVRENSGKLFSEAWEGMCRI